MLGSWFGPTVHPRPWLFLILGIWDQNLIGFGDRKIFIAACVAHPVNLPFIPHPMFHWISWVIDIHFDLLSVLCSLLYFSLTKADHWILTSSESESRVVACLCLPARPEGAWSLVDDNLCIILQLSHGDNTGTGTIDRIVLMVTTGSWDPVTLLILAIHWSQGPDLVNTCRGPSDYRGCSHSTLQLWNITSF